MHLNIHYPISLFLTAITVLSIGSFVYLKDVRNNIYKSYFIFHVSIFFWSFGEGFLIISPNINCARFWNIFCNIGIIFIAPSYIHFIFNLINISNRKKKLLVFVYLYSIGFLCLVFSDIFMPDPVPKFLLNYFIEPGPIYPVFVISWFIIIIYTTYELYKMCTTSYGSKKTQLKYLFIGAILGYTGGSCNYFLTFNHEIYPLNPYGTYMVPIYSILITYAMLRHKFLDINIVIRKTLIYSILASSIAIIFNLIIILIEHAFRQTVGYKTFPATLIAALFIAVFFQPFYKWLSSIVDKLFFKGTLPKVAEDLQRSEKLASLGVLASGLAHEIKNPLAPIKTYIQNLPNNADDKQYIDKISKIIPNEIDKITDIINQLRDFANPPELSITKVNIHNLIDKRLNLLEQDFISRKISVERKYSYDISEIHADPIQLERVFLNLFLNAIDATPHGGKITISTEISSDNSIIIKVQDTGIGIAKEDLPHIFDPFYSKGKYKGMGIGLAVVQQIIKNHNGNISVATVQGKGTSFCVFLPFK